MHNGAKLVLAIPLLLFILLAVGGTFVSDYPFSTTAFFADASARIDLDPQSYQQDCCIVVMNDSLRQIIVQTNGSINVRIVPEASQNQPVIDIFTAQTKQPISLPTGTFLITARNDGRQRITGSVVSYVWATHIDYRYKNWGVIARAYSPIALVSLGTLVLSTRVKERAGLPLRFFLEWAIPIGAYFALVSFVASALSADALQLQLKDWDCYQILTYLTEAALTPQSRPIYLMLYVLQPLLLAAELGLLLLVLRMDQYSSRTLFSNLRMLRIPSRLRVPDLARGVEALSVSGQLFVGGALLGILIVSIAGIRGAIPTLMPQPIGGFARLIMEKGIPVTEFPIEVIYLFGLGLPIAYALVMIQILWRGPESKNLLWILGAFGIASLGSWPFLPAKSADLVLLGQLLALPGLAINSLAFGIVCVLLDCRMRVLGTSSNIPTTDVDQADTPGTYC